MDKRERQRYDSHVIITWALIGIGAVVMFLLLMQIFVDLVDNIKLNF
jgi:hypothetical protein